MNYIAKQTITENTTNVNQIILPIQFFVWFRHRLFLTYLLELLSFVSGYILTIKGILLYYMINLLTEFYMNNFLMLDVNPSVILCVTVVYTFNNVNTSVHTNTRSIKRIISCVTTNEFSNFEFVYIYPAMRIY